MNTRRLGRRAVILPAAALTADTSLAIYRVFLAPPKSVEVELDAGAGPGPEMAKRMARTFDINISAAAKGHPSAGLSRSQAFHQAWLVPIPGACPNYLR